MFFREVIGQEAIKKRMIQSVNEGRVSHAQMLSGPAGTGTLALALAYAQYVSCSNKSENDSCGECPSCKKYKKLIHPDLHFVFPVVKTAKFKEPVSDNFLEEWRKLVLENSYFNMEEWFNFIGVENAQGLIYSHVSYEIIRKLNLKSFEAEYKVMIIWMPEKMHISCSNKLLKMIEEPPVKTLFILVTENEEDIIGTIRSRCQLTKVPRIDQDAMKTVFTEIQEAEGKDIDNLVHLSRGDYRKVLELLRTSESNQYNLERFKELMRFAYGRKFMDLFKWVDGVSSIGRERQKSLLNYSMGLIRENFVYNMKNPALIYMDEEEQNFSSRFSPFINERNIIPISEEMEKAYKHIEMNGNPRIIFTDFSLRIVKLIRK